MAVLSNSTYNNLNREFEKASLVLFNGQNEVVLCDSLISLKRTKSKISSKWNIPKDSDNNIPFNMAALAIRGKIVEMFNINLDSVGVGSINLDFDTED